MYIYNGARVQFIGVVCLFTARAVYAHRSSGEHLWFTQHPDPSPLEQSMLTARAVHTLDAKTNFDCSSFLSLLHFRLCLILFSPNFLWSWLPISWILTCLLLYHSLIPFDCILAKTWWWRCLLHASLLLCFLHFTFRLLSSFISSAGFLISTYTILCERAFRVLNHQGAILVMPSLLSISQNLNKSKLIHPSYPLWSWISSLTNHE